jgi:hypothetical protein
MHGSLFAPVWEKSDQLSMLWILTHAQVGWRTPTGVLAIMTTPPSADIGHTQHRAVYPLPYRCEECNSQRRTVARILLEDLSQQ